MNMHYLLIGLGAATWLVGGNFLILSHLKRIGKPFRFTAKNPWWRTFKLWEWVTLGVLTVVSVKLISIGDSLRP
jgi:hypothetical protein